MPSDGRVLVDDRWRGTHGIARFSHEVLSRLRTPASRLGGPTDPLSPLDVINPRRLGLRSSDLVYSPGFNAGLTRAAQLLTLHDLIHLADPAEQDLRKRLYYDRLVRPAVIRAGRVLTVSATSRTVVRDWIDDAVPVIDVGNGCSDVFFSTASAPERSGVLYVGNLKPHKNPSAAFAAVARTPEILLTVVTHDAPEAERLAAEAGITERVAVLSGVTDADLAQLYGSTRALLMPSLVEGFGLPAAEALAMGCPVLHWSGCAAVSEIVADDGVAVEDAHDPLAWAEGLQRVLARDVDGARRRIRSGYSWDAVAARVDEQLGAA